MYDRMIPGERMNVADQNSAHLGAGMLWLFQTNHILSKLATQNRHDSWAQTGRALKP